MKGNKESTQDTAFAPYHFEKDKLPKILSYPVKRSLLDVALLDFGAVAAQNDPHRPLPN